MNVRVYGDAAVVTGLEMLQGTAKDYAAGPRRFTDLWVKRNGRWQQLGGQSTLVAPTNSQDAVTGVSAVKALTSKALTPKSADEAHLSPRPVVGRLHDDVDGSALSADMGGG